MRDLGELSHLELDAQMDVAERALAVIRDAESQKNIFGLMVDIQERIDEYRKPVDLSTIPNELY